MCSLNGLTSDFRLQAQKLEVHYELLCFLFVFFLQFLLIFYSVIIRRIQLSQISFNLDIGGFKQLGEEVLNILRRGMMLFNTTFLFIGLQRPYVTERSFSKTMAILLRGQFV